MNNLELLEQRINQMVSALSKLKEEKQQFLHKIAQLEKDLAKAQAQALQNHNKIEENNRLIEENQKFINERQQIQSKIEKIISAIEEIEKS